MAKKKSQRIKRPVSPTPDQRLGETEIAGVKLHEFAEYIVDEHRRRKLRRHGLEKQWAEVDRQVAMEAKGLVTVDQRDPESSTWMPNLEMPNQAESLEVLGSDAHSMMFDPKASWFSAKAALSDKFMKRWESKPMIGGDEIGIPTRITQDGANRVTEAALNFFHRRYDFKSRVDMLNAEAFKYGTFTARGLMINEETFSQDATGLKALKFKVPQLVPRSIKSVYLDDTPMQILHEGYSISPSFICAYWQSAADLIRTAAMPGAAEDGWILSAVLSLQGSSSNQDHKGQVECLEFEGDFVQQDGNDVVYVPNVIMNVAVSENTHTLYRMRERDFPWRSYIVGYYHRDKIDSPYGTGPLLKGVPVQKALTEAANRTMQVAALQAEPPVRYDPNDWRLANAGGPRIEPRALWPSMTKPEIIEIGDLGSMLAVYQGLDQKYQSLTSVFQPRAGAPTKSHTTAYAISNETTRGESRTVDFSNTVLEEPLTWWLHMELEMAKEALKKPQMIYVDEYEGWVEIDKDHLPDDCVFKVFGAAEAANEMQENNAFIQLGAGLLKFEPMARQLGGKPLNVDKLREETLRRAGVDDVKSYFEEIPAGTGAPSPLAAAGIPPAPPGGQQVSRAAPASGGGAEAAASGLGAL